MTSTHHTSPDPLAITVWSLALAAGLSFWGVVTWGVIRFVGWVS